MNMKKKKNTQSKFIRGFRLEGNLLIGFGLLSSKEADASESVINPIAQVTKQSKSNDSSSVSAAPNRRHKRE